MTVTEHRLRHPFRSRKRTIIILLVLFIWADTDWGGCESCPGPEQSRGIVSTVVK